MENAKHATVLSCPALMFVTAVYTKELVFHAVIFGIEETLVGADVTWAPVSTLP
jgi:hypothetical protein